MWSKWYGNQVRGKRLFELVRESGYQVVGLTEHKDADNDGDSQDKTIQSVDSLIYIVHAGVDRFALPGVIGNSHNHLLQTNIAIAIAVE